MLKIIRRQLSVPALFLFLLILAGCGATSTPSRFYVLSSMDNLATDQETKTDLDSIRICIGAVSLPKYLEKHQIVTRSGSNELQLAEFDRWAGNFEEDIGNVVAENLALLLSSDQVFSYQAIDVFDEADYTVAIDISRFDGRLGERVELVARWTILDGTGEEVKGITATHIIEPVQGDTYADMVAAQSRALASLSREIGTAFKDLRVR